MAPLHTTRLACAAAALAASAMAFAADLAPNDFAWRAPLETAAGASLVRVDMPAAALGRLRVRGAADVRVFNAAGEAVPYAWITPPDAPAAAPETRVARWPALPLYSAKPAAAPKGGVQVRIEGDGGAQRSVWVQLEGKAAPPADTVNSVLFDTRAQREAVSAIELSATLPANTPVRMTVYSSGDLSTWTYHPVRGRVYRFDGEVAPSNLRLAFDTRVNLQGRFLRVDWDGQPGVAVASATGVMIAAAPPRRVTTPLALPKAADEAIEVDTGFATPVAGISISTTRDNALVPVSVLGRDDAAQPWRLLGTTVVYRLGNGTQAVSNPPLDLQGASVKRLKIMSTNHTKLDAFDLKASVEFTPLQLVFVASGAGPYTLAAGREGTAPAALPAGTVTGMLGVQKLQDLPLAVPGPAVEAAAQGWARTLWPGAPAKSAVLWGVLLAGVLLLAAVAWTLLRQTKSPPTDK